MRFFFEESRKLTLLYRRLETCGKPFAIAVNGVCLGGAFELALACHYRVVSDDPSTRVGLPEVKVGPVPRRGRHAARGAAYADRRRPADAVQGRADPRRRGQDDGPRARGGPARRDRGAGEGVHHGRRQGRAALGREGLEGPLRPCVLAAGHDDLAGRERHLPPRDAGQLSRREGDPPCRLRGPAAADGPRPAGREPLVRQSPALAGSGRDDPHAVRLHAGAEQGCAPAQGRAADAAEEGRRARRGLHGRGHRLCHGECRDRGGADRPRPGERRKGQGAFPQAHDRPDHEGPRQDGGPRRAAGAHHRHARLRGAGQTATSWSRPCSRIPR